jgi:hypothetical protein
MRNRKDFLAAVTASAALALAAKAQAGAGPSAPPNATPSAVPKAQSPSAAALAVAVAMRRFDSKLSDREIETIARGIDDNAKAGGALNPRKKRLRNWDEPVTTFAVESE